MPLFVKENDKEEVLKIMKESFAKNKDKLIERCKKYAPEFDGKVEENDLFKLRTKYSFSTLADQLSKL
jgi:hypothetical protein